MEKGLGLCCEEAVRLLLASTGNAHSPIIFAERNIDDIPDEIPEDALEARNAIFEEREHLFKILADYDRPLNDRLIEILDFAAETSGFNISYQSETGASPITDKKIANNIQQSWIDLLGKGESFGPAWDTAYKQLKQSWTTCNSKPLFTDSDGEKIIAYQLFRYYAKSLFDGNSLTKVQFALYFWIMLQKFGNILAGTKIDAIKLLSKQTEYSEEIMGILEEEFIENPAFSALNFKRILTE